MQNLNEFSPKVTEDGSFTFFSPEFGEKFHSRFGAKIESEITFVESCQLVQKAESQNSLKILDICYGLGYNTAAALNKIWQVNPNCFVELVGLELNPVVPQEAIAFNLLNVWEEPIPKLLGELAKTYSVKTPQLNANLLIGDARKSIQSLSENQFKADAVFLDPFSPPKCPQLWTVEFLGRVAQCMTPNARLATYSCSAAVRSALGLVGLKFGSIPNVGKRSPGTVASFNESDLKPLSQAEKEHLNTRAAIPYRDPRLSDSAKEIIERRQAEQQTSELEPTTHWKKRFFGSGKDST